VNRVSLDGQCADSWLDFRRAEEVIRHLERKYELTSVACSWESQRTADSEGQIRRLKREASLGENPQESVETRIRQTRTGFIQGISYELDSVAFPGHKLGRNYGWSGLQKLGITENLELSLQKASTVTHSVNRKSKKRSTGLEL
jgi:hypothetical protein